MLNLSLPRSKRSLSKIVKDTLQKAWNTIATRIDGLSARERLLVFVTILTVFFLGFSELTLGPLHHAQQQMEARIHLKQKQLAATHEAIQTLANEQQLDSADATRKRLAELQKMLGNTTQPLVAMAAGMVDPREMVQLAKNLLASNHKVDVLSMKNMPPVAILNSDEIHAADQKAALDDEFHLYKHGLRLRLRGPYRNLVRSIAALEALPWKVLWSEIELNAEDTGQPVVEIVLYTLSQKRAWIGV